MTKEEWLEVLASMDNPAMSAWGEELVSECHRLTALLSETREALSVFKRYGEHRGSCVQMTGKQCSCGFDDAATKAGGLVAVLSRAIPEKK